MTEEKATETEAKNGKVKLNVLAISSPQQPLKLALDKLYTESFGVQANKVIYKLQKELQPHANEYMHLRRKLEQEPGNVEGKKLSKKGLEELIKLNEEVAKNEIEVETLLPIKLKLLDCFSSNDRIMLEETGIAEFEE